MVRAEYDGWKQGPNVGLSLGPHLVLGSFSWLTPVEFAVALQSLGEAIRPLKEIVLLILSICLGVSPCLLGK